MQIRPLLAMLSCALILSTLAACGDDDDNNVTPTPDPEPEASPNPDPEPQPDPEPTPTPDPTPDPEPEGPQTFEITLENTSNRAALPVPVSPGVWALHTAPAPFFTPGEPDRGMGLEMLAEDGNNSVLGESLDGGDGVDGLTDSGTFDAPILPGETLTLSVEATGGALSVAGMFVHSNDIIIATDPEGIPLFDDAGAPLGERNVTDHFGLWDVGTEVNEAPGFGRLQAPAQSGPDVGASEGVVARFDHPTRALPLASKIVDVSVSETGGTFTFVVENASAARGAIQTPVAPVFWALHDDSWSLFDLGDDASAGLEMLSEDGSPMGLLTEHDGAAGTTMIGAQPITDERPDDPPGASMPGERFTFEVTPTAAGPRLSFAAMVVESNDVFLALAPEGVALLDDADAPRAAEDVARDIHAMLALWDAGTEANEVPGRGANQAIRQAVGNTGDDDPTPGVRLYADRTNDLEGPMAGGFAQVSIEAGADDNTFTLIVTNSSAGSPFPGILTPVLHGVHTADVDLVPEGQPASPGLELLAEAGDPSVWLGELEGAGQFAAAAVPEGQGDPGPIGPGGVYRATITATPEARFLSLATMVVPSNDTFLSLEGLALLDEAGDPRALEDINADIAANLTAWDAGTELNQAGAAGPDQAPFQSAPDAGVFEGDGLVRLAEQDVWALPNTESVLRVTIKPVP